MSRALHALPRRERELVDALFALGNRASAEALRAAMNDPPSYSAVRAMLARLEQKGQVRHDEEGGKYIYSATTSRTSASRTAVAECLRVFFDNSRTGMMTALLRQERWSPDDLDALQAEIDRARKNGRPR